PYNRTGPRGAPHAAGQCQSVGWAVSAEGNPGRSVGASVCLQVSRRAWGRAGHYLVWGRWPGGWRRAECGYFELEELSGKACQKAKWRHFGGVADRGGDRWGYGYDCAACFFERAREHAAFAGFRFPGCLSQRGDQSGGAAPGGDGDFLLASW